MAEGMARALGAELIDAYSAGTNPTGVISEDAVEIMKEVKIDLGGLRSKGLIDVPVSDMDIVVSMAPRSAQSIVPRGFRGRTIDWRVEDPVGKSLTVFRRVRGELDVLVRQLIEDVRRHPPAA